MSSTLHYNVLHPTLQCPPLSTPDPGEWPGPRRPRTRDTPLMVFKINHLAVRWKNIIRTARAECF